MANDDLSEEIQLLRKQLEELQKQQDTPKPQTVVEVVEEIPVEEPMEEVDRRVPGTESAANNETEIGQDLANQLRELLDSIDNDIKDAKPSTLLVVFALGVLVGRL